MKKTDSLGFLLIGLSIVFLVAILFGHQRREHLANRASRWESIRQSLEDEVKQKYDYSVAEFRTKVSNQNDFFAWGESALKKFDEASGLSFLTRPEVKDMKDVDKPFDELYRLVDVRMKELVEFGRKRNPDDPQQDLSSIWANFYTKHNKSVLTFLAKNYMFQKLREVNPMPKGKSISKALK